MKRFIFGLLLVGSAFAQSTIVPAVNPLAVSPNLVLMLIFLWSGLRGTREGLVWAFLVGILLDVLSVQTLGINGLALAGAVLLAGPAQNRMFRSNVFFSIILMFVASVVYCVLVYALRDMRPTIFILVQSLMHAALVPFAYLVIRTLDR
jgi:rod shape-determining protein MreD